MSKIVTFFLIALIVTLTFLAGASLLQKGSQKVAEHKAQQKQQIERILDM